MENLQNNFKYAQFFKKYTAIFPSFFQMILFNSNWEQRLARYIQVEQRVE